MEHRDNPGPGGLTDRGPLGDKAERESAREPCPAGETGEEFGGETPCSAQIWRDYFLGNQQEP